MSSIERLAWKVADGVHASMDANQKAAADEVRDRAVADAEFMQLITADMAAERVGDPPDQNFPEVLAALTVRTPGKFCWVGWLGV